MDFSVSTNHHDPRTDFFNPSMIEVKKEFCDEDLSNRPNDFDDFDFEPFHENIFRTLTDNFDNDANIGNINDACTKLENCFIKNNVLNKNGSTKFNFTDPFVDFIRYRDIDDAFVNMVISESDCEPRNNAPLKKIDFKHLKDPFSLNDLPDVTQKSIDEDDLSKIDSDAEEINELQSHLEMELSPSDDDLAGSNFSDNDLSIVSEDKNVFSDNILVNSTNSVRTGAKNSTTSGFFKSANAVTNNNLLQDGIRDVRVLVEKIPGEFPPDNEYITPEELNSKLIKSTTDVRRVARKKTGGAVIRSNISPSSDVNKELDNVDVNEEETKAFDKMTRSAKRDLERVIAESTVNLVMQKTTELISEKIKDLQPAEKDSSEDEAGDTDIHKTAEIVTNTILKLLTKNRCKNVDKLGKVISEDIASKVSNILKQTFEDSTPNESPPKIPPRIRTNSTNENSRENIESPPVDSCELTNTRRALRSNSPKNKKRIQLKGHHSNRALEVKLNELANIEKDIINCQITAPLMDYEFREFATNASQAASNFDKENFNEFNQPKVEQESVKEIQTFFHLESPASPDNEEQGSIKRPTTRQSVSKNNQSIPNRNDDKSNTNLAENEINVIEELRRRKINKSDKDIVAQFDKTTIIIEDPTRPRTTRQSFNKQNCEQNQPTPKDEKYSISMNSFKDNKKPIVRQTVARMEREMALEQNKDNESNRRPVTRQLATKSLKETSLSNEQNETQSNGSDRSEEKPNLDQEHGEPEKRRTRRSTQRTKEDVKVGVVNIVAESVVKPLESKRKRNPRTKKNTGRNRARNRNVNPRNKLQPLSSKTFIDGQFLIDDFTDDTLSANDSELTSKHLKDRTILKARADSTTRDSVTNDSVDNEVNDGKLVCKSKKENNDIDVHSPYDQECRNSKDVSKLFEAVLDESLRKNNLNKELTKDSSDSSKKNAFKVLNSPTVKDENLDAKVAHTVEPFQILNDMITDIEENLLKEGEIKKPYEPDNIVAKSPEISADSTSFLNYTIDDSFKLVIDESLFKDEDDSEAEETLPSTGEKSDANTKSIAPDESVNLDKNLPEEEVKEEKYRPPIQEETAKTPVVSIVQANTAIEETVVKPSDQSKSEVNNFNEKKFIPENIRLSLDEDRSLDSINSDSSISLKTKTDPFVKNLTNEEKIAQLTRRDPRLLNEKKVSNVMLRDPRLRRNLPQIEEKQASPIPQKSNVPEPISSTVPVSTEVKIPEENPKVKVTNLKKTELKLKSEIELKPSDVKPSAQPDRPISPNPPENLADQKKSIELTNSTTPLLPNPSIVKCGMLDNSSEQNRKKKSKKTIDEELLYKTPLSDLHDTHSDCPTYQRDVKKRIVPSGRRVTEIVDCTQKHRSNEDLPEDRKYTNRDTQEERNFKSNTSSTLRQEIRFNEEVEANNSEKNFGKEEWNQAHPSGSKDSFEGNRRHVKSRSSSCNRSINQDHYAHTRREVSRKDRFDYRDASKPNNYTRQEKLSFNQHEKFKIKEESDRYSGYPSVSKLPENDGLAMGYGDMELGSSPLGGSDGSSSHILEHRRSAYSPSRITRDEINHTTQRKYESEDKDYRIGRNKFPRRGGGGGGGSSSSIKGNEYIHRRFDSPPRKRFANDNYPNRSDDNRGRWRRSPSWSPERSKRRFREVSLSPEPEPEPWNSRESRDVHSWNAARETQYWNSIREEQVSYNGVREEQPQWNHIREEQPQWNHIREEQPQWNHVREEQPHWSHVREEQPHWNTVYNEQSSWNSTIHQEPQQSSWNNPINEEQSWNSIRHEQQQALWNTEEHLWNLEREKQQTSSWNSASETTSHPWNSARDSHVWNSPPRNRSPSPPARYDNYRGRSSYYNRY